MKKILLSGLLVLLPGGLNKIHLRSEVVEMKKKSISVIWMAIFCFIMTTSNIAWSLDPATLIPDSGTITDTSTGLIWLKNANCFGKLTYDVATAKVRSLQSGACGLLDMSKSGDWRIPTLHELRNWKQNKHGWVNLKGDYYWTSTPHNNDMSVVHMGFNSEGGWGKGKPVYVWPVRNAR